MFDHENAQQDTGNEQKDIKKNQTKNIKIRIWQKEYSDNEQGNNGLQVLSCEQVKISQVKVLNINPVINNSKGGEKGQQNKKKNTPNELMYFAFNVLKIRTAFCLSSTKADSCCAGESVRDKNAVALCGCVLCPRGCEVCSVAWGQAVRQNRLWGSCPERRGGRGDRPADGSLLPVCTPVISSPDLPAESKKPFDKNCQLNRDQIAAFVSPSIFWHYLLCFMLLPLFSFKLCLNYFSRSRPNGKTPCCISDLVLESVQLSLGPSEKWIKACKSFFLLWQRHL